MRHHHEMALTDLRFDPAQQPIVEGPQVLLRALRQSRQVRSNSCRSIASRVDLKTTPLDFRNDLRFSSEVPHDFNLFIRDDERDEFVVERRVLNQRALSAESGLELSKRKEILLLRLVTASTT